MVILMCWTSTSPRKHQEWTFSPPKKEVIQCFSEYPYSFFCCVETPDHTAPARPTSPLPLPRKQHSEKHFQRPYSDTSKLQCTVPGEQVQTDHLQCFWIPVSCESNRNFKVSIHRKRRQNPNTYTVLLQALPTKYGFPHWQASLGEQNVHAAQKAIPSAFWKVPLTASSFSFLVSKVCLWWECSHSSLSFQQALCYQTNMSSQHFKMHVKVTLHKFEGQKQIHWIEKWKPSAWHKNSRVRSSTASISTSTITPSVCCS